MLTRDGVDGPEVVDYLKYTACPRIRPTAMSPTGNRFTAWSCFARPRRIQPRGGGPAGGGDLRMDGRQQRGRGVGRSGGRRLGRLVRIVQFRRRGSGSGGLLPDRRPRQPAKVSHPRWLHHPGRRLPVGVGGRRTGAESSGPPHLHADFKLGAGGEAIGLFAPIEPPSTPSPLAAQTADVSEGPLPEPDGPVAALAPTPGGQNFLTLPGTQPIIHGLEWLPGFTLVVNFRALPGATYRLEGAMDPLRRVAGARRARAHGL